MAVYSFCISSLMGRQFLDPAKNIPGHEVSLDLFIMGVQKRRRKCKKYDIDKKNIDISITYNLLLFAFNSNRFVSYGVFSGIFSQQS